METRLYVLPVVLLEFEAPYSIETFIHIEKEIFLETEYIQQTELNPAPSYPTSESTAVFSYFHRLK